MTVMTDPTRGSLIKAVHARARELGIEAEDRKVMQARVTGHASCRDMSAADLRAVLAEFDRVGASGPGDGMGNDERRRDRVPDSPHKAKLWALWLSGWHLGVVRKPTEKALVAFIKRQTGLDAAAWAHDTRETGKAVEGVKDWLAREAGVDCSPYATADGEAVDNPRARVLEAQWRILADLGRVRIADPGALAAYAGRYAGIGRRISHADLDADAAIALITHLGERIRVAKGVQR